MKDCWLQLIRNEESYLGYVAIDLKKKEKCNSFDGTWKMTIKMLNLLLYSNTDWTLQSHRVAACEDFLKLIEKIKHFSHF